jgi:hypothetical protein
VGEPVRASPPSSAILAFILGSASAPLISRFTLSTTSFGVFSGAAMPNEAPASKPEENRRSSAAPRKLLPAPRTPDRSRAQLAGPDKFD